jgi:multidrug efflux pump
VAAISTRSAIRCGKQEIETCTVFSRGFITRLILALLLIGIILAVGIAVLGLAVWRYLQAPLPTVEVWASYPGANAQLVADAVAVPIEREVDGVENMVAMSRQCTDDGGYRLTITFRRGTDVNLAQVLVQNRLALAQPRLPDAVQRAGLRVTTQPMR